MKRITLTIVAVLLAVPVAANAKVGIEFDQDIGMSKPGEQQGFTVIAHGGGGSGGARPMVTFRSESSGKVIRVRATPLGPQGTARASVRFPDHGPWTTSLSVAGKSLGDAMFGQRFEVGEARSVHIVGTMEPPADPPVTPSDDGGGFPAWLLTLPAAALAALAIWRFRRRPRELGA